MFPVVSGAFGGAGGWPGGLAVGAAGLAHRDRASGAAAAAAVSSSRAAEDFTCNRCHARLTAEDSIIDMNVTAYLLLRVGCHIHGQETGDVAGRRWRERLVG